MSAEPSNPNPECTLCASRSHWDFLKEFYQREDIYKSQVQNMSQHIGQLNAALHHAGHGAQKDRIALNKAHEHIKELQYGLSQSEIGRAKLENSLQQERQDYHMCQESLTHERARHEETEKHLECIWNSHKRLGTILSDTRCKVDPERQGIFAEYDIAGLILEIEAKTNGMSGLKASLEQERVQSRATIEELEARIDCSNARHAEEIATMEYRYHEMEMLLRQEQAKPFGNPIEQGPRRRKRHRHGRKAPEGPGQGSGLSADRTDTPPESIIPPPEVKQRENEDFDIKPED